MLLVIPSDLCFVDIHRYRATYNGLLTVALMGVCGALQWGYLTSLARCLTMKNRLVVDPAVVVTAL